LPRGRRKNEFCNRSREYLNDPRIELFAALACGQRLEILRLLQDREKCVSELTPELGIDASVVSRHLLILKNVGMITGRRNGSNNYYMVTDKRIFSLLDQTSSILRDRAKQNMNRYK